MKILHSVGAGLLSATSILAGRVAFPLLFLGAGLVLVPRCAGGSGVFNKTGSLATARLYHRATLLPNGKVLVAGGQDVTGNPFASAELYDPASGTWTATGSLASARNVYTATLLPNGKVLVAGGAGTSGGLASAELYDPASGTWTATGSLGAPRLYHTATLLPNGKVLVAGGSNSTGFLASAELYDPASGTWTATGSLASARNVYTATLLPNGKVLVAGGAGTSGGLASAELYDPASGTWTATGSLATAREVHTATLLPNGKVLAAGGYDGFSLASAELYDPASGIWTATGSLATPRDFHTATLLSDGKVLVAGGQDNNPNSIASAELYDPASGTWTATGSLATARAAHTATLLPNVQVLVAGGSRDGVTLASAELYGPASPFIISPLNAMGTAGQQFIYQFEASGATSLSITNLPAELTFNGSLAAIVGTPTAAGIFQVGLSASNTAGTTTATLTLTVQPAPTSGPIIGSSTAATGRVGRPFSFQVFTIGGTSGARVSASGLPPGLNIDAVTGLISGTPTAEGSSAVTLTVTDGAFTTSSILELTFITDPARPVIVSPNSASLPAGQFFTYTIMADAPGSTFALVGTLPAGLGFDGINTISGTYTGPLRPELAGGAILGSIQLFGTTGQGTSAFQLLFRRPPSGVVNISTRLPVEMGENVLIGGFIITGDAPKVVIIRAIGPSLNPFLSGALQDPTLELHSSANPDVVVSNDNWRDTQEQFITDTGIPPTNDLESALVIGLDPGAYTAIVRGNNDTTGIALVEVYDLGTASLNAAGNDRLGNIATRGLVNTGDNVMIGGFQIRVQATRVVVRAIGPSLSAFGISGALQDPTLELKDANGVTLINNDDWQVGRPPAEIQEIQQLGLAPSDPRESALITTPALAPGGYTAIVRGKNNTTGVALVEVYALP